MIIYWNLRGRGSGGQYELGEKTTLGRAKDNEVYLLDPRLSRHHARIRRDGEGYVLEDLGSRNGTMLNGEKVDRGELRPGDVIQIGDTTIRFGEPLAEKKESPALLVVAGERTGRRYPLEKDSCALGRRGGNDIVVKDVRTTSGFWRISRARTAPR